MSWITTILSPSFLVDNIELISFITGVMVLIIFDEFVIGRVIFPVADFIKYYLAKGINLIYEKKGIHSKLAKGFKRYSSEAVATLMVIAYCYVGYWIVAKLVIEPILIRWQPAILLVVIVLFFVFSYLINKASWRRQFFGVGIYNPDRK